MLHEQFDELLPIDKPKLRAVPLEFHGLSAERAERYAQPVLALPQRAEQLVDFGARDLIGLTLALHFQNGRLEPKLVAVGYDIDAAIARTLPPEASSADRFKEGRSPATAAPRHAPRLKPETQPIPNAFFGSLPQKTSEAHVHVSVITNDQQIECLMNESE